MFVCNIHPHDITVTLYPANFSVHCLVGVCDACSSGGRAQTVMGIPLRALRTYVAPAPHVRASSIFQKFLLVLGSRVVQPAVFTLSDTAAPLYRYNHAPRKEETGLYDCV